MTPRARRTAMLAAGAAVLLLALAFLFVKTMGTGYKDQAQAISLLRELRDVDARWDADALRLANDLAGKPSVPDRSAFVARILNELERGGAKAALGSQLGELRAGMASKQEAYAALRKAHD